MSGLSREEMKKRMDPTHLTGEEMKEEVEKQAEHAKPQTDEKKDPEEDPKSQREYSFEFEWKDGNGKVWRGKFLNRVPDIRTRQLIGALRSQLGNNIPFDSLDPTTREMNMVIAHLSFSLIKRPTWADDLSELFNFELVQMIYQEVAAHEATFLGYGALAASG